MWRCPSCTGLEANTLLLPYLYSMRWLIGSAHFSAPVHILNNKGKLKAKFTSSSLTKHIMFPLRAILQQKMMRCAMSEREALRCFSENWNFTANLHIFK